MTPEICTCGHREGKHDEYGECRYKEYDNSYGYEIENCPCKKFTSHSQQSATETQAVNDRNKFADTHNQKTPSEGKDELDRFIVEKSEGKYKVKDNIKCSLCEVNWKDGFKFGYETARFEDKKKTPSHDFVLSEKIRVLKLHLAHNECDICQDKIDEFEKDVKEFIKRDEDLIHLILNRMITRQEFWNKRDKLAGEELK